MPEPDLIDLFVRPLTQNYLRDIRGMLSVSGEQMDQVELLEWVARRGLEAEWEKARS